MKTKLSIKTLCEESRKFAMKESKHQEPELFGVTDGKAVGTYLEHKFRNYLCRKYEYAQGNSAKGIDFPDLEVDMKVTSVRQPQSSCPYKSARQKIYGLGYSLLVFVYEKTDDSATRTSRLKILHTIFIHQSRTADYQTTVGIKDILENSGNTDDLVAFMQDRFLPVDDVQALKLSEEILRSPPEIGYLTISNALQWRLQYKRVINYAGDIQGIERIQ